MLERTDRVWVSDCIDPLDRQTMMRWTMQLLPPELLGSHIASGVSHTTGRAHRLAFRAGSALYYVLLALFVANLYDRTLSAADIGMIGTGATVAALR